MIKHTFFITILFTFFSLSCEHLLLTEQGQKIDYAPNVIVTQVKRQLSIGQKLDKMLKGVKKLFARAWLKIVAGTQTIKKETSRKIHEIAALPNKVTDWAQETLDEE